RFEKRIGLLIAKQARLQFDVSAVVVGKRRPPVRGVAIVTPRPDLVRRKLRRRRHMNGAAVGTWVIDADESFLRGVGEQRYRTVDLVSNDAEIASLFVDRPSFDPSEAMGGHQLGWIDEM